MPKTALPSDGEPKRHSLPDHQRAAAASPHTPISELVGNFTDLEGLFDRLGELSDQARPSSVD